jgi:hypothetical protein
MSMSIAKNNFILRCFLEEEKQLDNIRRPQTVFV